MKKLILLAFLALMHITGTSQTIEGYVKTDSIQSINGTDDINLGSPLSALSISSDTLFFHPSNYIFYPGSGEIRTVSVNRFRSYAGTSLFELSSTRAIIDIGGGADEFYYNTTGLSINTGIAATEALDVTGNGKFSGNVNVGSATHLFSYFGDSTVTFTYAASDTWYHLTNASDSMFRWTELDGFTVSNDTITIANTADYDIRAKVTMDGGNGQTYSMRFYNVTQTVGVPVAGATTMRGANNFESIIVDAYGEFTAGDEVVLQIKSDGTTSNTFKNGIIKIYYIHD